MSHATDGYCDCCLRSRLVCLDTARFRLGRTLGGVQRLLDRVLQQYLLDVVRRVVCVQLPSLLDELLRQ